MAEEFKEMNKDELEGVSGGTNGIEMIGGPGNKSGKHHSSGNYKTVTGLQTGFLAIRSQPVYDASNEIGKLYNGEEVQIVGTPVYTGRDYDPKYDVVYSPRLKVQGYVNSRFIN